MRETFIEIGPVVSEFDDYKRTTTSSLSIHNGIECSQDVLFANTRVSNYKMYRFRKKEKTPVYDMYIIEVFFCNVMTTFRD